MVPETAAVERGGGGRQGPGHAPGVHGPFRRGRPLRQHLRPDGGVGGSGWHRGAVRRRPHERHPGHASAGPLPGLRRPRDAHPRRLDPGQPGGHQRLRGAEGGPRQAGPVLPRAVRRPRGPGRRWLRVPGGGAALQPELRQEPGRLRLHRRPGRLVGRGRRRHRGPRRHRLLPRRHRGGHHGLRGHPRARDPAHRPRGFPERLRGHVAAGHPHPVPALPRAREGGPGGGSPEVQALRGAARHLVQPPRRVRASPGRSPARLRRESPPGVSHARGHRSGVAELGPSGRGPS